MCQLAAKRSRRSAIGAGRRAGRQRKAHWRLGEVCKPVAMRRWNSQRRRKRVRKGNNKCIVNNNSNKNNSNNCSASNITITACLHILINAYSIGPHLGLPARRNALITPAGLSVTTNGAVTYQHNFFRLHNSTFNTLRSLNTYFERISLCYVRVLCLSLILKFEFESLKVRAMSLSPTHTCLLHTYMYIYIIFVFWQYTKNTYITECMYSCICTYLLTHFMLYFFLH